MERRRADAFSHAMQFRNHFASVSHPFRKKNERGEKVSLKLSDFRDFPGWHAYCIDPLRKSLGRRGQAQKNLVASRIAFRRAIEHRIFALVTLNHIKTFRRNL